MMNTPNYGSVCTDTSNYESRSTTNTPKSSIGGARPGPSRRKILIRKIQTNIESSTTPSRPTIGQSTPTITPYETEELEKLSLQKLQRIYDETTKRLPLSQKFSKKDRELASRCEEYKNALKDYSNEDTNDDIEPIDLC